MVPMASAGPPLRRDRPRKKPLRIRTEGAAVAAVDLHVKMPSGPFIGDGLKRGAVPTTFWAPGGRCTGSDADDIELGIAGDSALTKTPR
jgi:hypothetical protein